MEYVKGIKITDFKKLEEAGLDKKPDRSKRRKFSIKTDIHLCLLSGRPAPGNILVKEDNVIVVLDFGMFGRIDEKTKEQIADILIAVIKKDVDKIVKDFS